MRVGEKKEPGDETSPTVPTSLIISSFFFVSNKGGSIQCGNLMPNKIHISWVYVSYLGSFFSPFLTLPPNLIQSNLAVNLTISDILDLSTLSGCLIHVAYIL